LIEIFSVLQATKVQLPDEVGEKLEDMIFVQLKNTDPDKFSDNDKASFRQASLDYFSRLIGAMSKLRFSSVTARFIGIPFY
jgi:hypothetical protein